MPNIDKLIEYEYINKDVVEESKTKTAIIIGAGKLVNTEWGTWQLEIPVELDKVQIKYSVNLQTLRNLAKKWGTNTDNWIGKMVLLSVGEYNNRKIVIGQPI